MRKRRWAARVLWPLALLWTIPGMAIAQGLPLATTTADFYQPGTQRQDPLSTPMESMLCALCHGNYSEREEPYTRWASSIHGQAGRDPLMWAMFAVSKQAVPGVEEFCMRCHGSLGWLDPAQPPPGPWGNAADGVSCSLCHRSVDPVYRPGHSPREDREVLAATPDVPAALHSGEYTLDQQYRLRGPFRMEHGFTGHNFGPAFDGKSALHKDARLCGTCHDASNPLMVRQPDGRYIIGDLNQPHPTMNIYDGFPFERTFSEWARSDFAKRPIDMGTRFGGNRGPVSTCQDCHMPTTTGIGAKPIFNSPVRDQLPLHNFSGSNTWVLPAVLRLYGPAETGLTESSVAAGNERNAAMLRAAADLHLTVANGRLLVRVVNQTGHRLPTGVTALRRMWLNVRFLDGAGATLSEVGIYDPAEATLNSTGTKVYTAVVGIDEPLAAQLGVQPGPTVYAALMNKQFFDNSIPPRGFVYESFAAAQCAPVGYTYQDGQFWDDTGFEPPQGAKRAEVTLYFQSITREVIEGLRDANTSNNAGQVLYEQWVAGGKCPPVLMATSTLDLPSACRADFDGNGVLDTRDVIAFRQALRDGDPRADVNDDGLLDRQDLAAFLELFRCGCGG